MPEETIDLELKIASAIGQSEQMKETANTISLAALTDASILLIGEVGTGKSYLARLIHEHSRRSKQPYVAINCGAIPENLLESDLFGHERGSFTGADKQRHGFFETASEGTLFLDEAHHMSPKTQASLLQVLEEKTFYRVGGSQPLTTDARVISASSESLDAEVASGRFLRALRSRIGVIEIRLPPLRDRGNDKINFAKHYLAQYCSKYGKTLGFDDTAMDFIMNYSWPENVRELKKVMERAVILFPHKEGIINGNFLKKHTGSKETPSYSAYSIQSIARDQFEAANGAPIDYRRVTNDFGKALIEEAMRRHGNNKLQAAIALGIPRTVLYDLLERYSSGRLGYTRK